MKVLIYGVGAIGSLMAHYLCVAGNDVTVVARSTYEELNREGLRIRHYLQRRTTVDHPRVVRAAGAERYDIVFSVMQGQQQLALLDTLAAVDAGLIVLVGNNPEAERCAEALRGRRVLYGFQSSAGHREGATAVVGRLPTTELILGGLHGPAPAEDVALVRSAFPGKGYKVTAVDSMYGFFLYHIAEIMPYCYLCYRVSCDLKRASGRDIKMIVKATAECFDYLKGLGVPVVPPREDEYYTGSKAWLMLMLYRIMAKTVLGRLMVSDHCKNGVAEMAYLDERFEAYRGAHPGAAMPVWEEMRAWAQPTFEAVKAGLSS